MTATDLNSPNPEKENEFHGTLKNIEAILLRLESRFTEHFPTFAESRDTAKRFATALETKRLAESTKSCNGVIIND
jgi:hypothetical protein